jgi:predicted transcriptional regulator
MGSKNNHQVALLSIHPQYANAIVDGKKRVEFRKTKFSKDIKSVVIYATNPLKKVLGYFEISYIEEANPRYLWIKHKNAGHIDYKDFNKYYSSPKYGIAIVIRSVWVLKRPVKLNALDLRLSAPQSFSYVSKSIFNRLKKRACFKLAPNAH